MKYLSLQATVRKYHACNNYLQNNNNIINNSNNNHNNQITEWYQFVHLINTH